MRHSWGQEYERVSLPTSSRPASSSWRSGVAASSQGTLGQCLLAAQACWGERGESRGGRGASRHGPSEGEPRGVHGRRGVFVASQLRDSSATPGRTTHVQRHGPSRCRPPFVREHQPMNGHAARRRHEGSIGPCEVRRACIVPPPSVTARWSIMICIIQ
jgi:hypothetical protein